MANAEIIKGGKNMLKIKILPNNNFRISGDIISDSIKREKVKFDFTEEWEGFIKTAVFSYGDDTVINIILNGENELCTAEDECYIPFEVLKSPCFSISVFGLKGDIRLTTPKREVKVTKSGYELGDSPETPTPDEYAQLTQMYEEIKEIAVSVRTDADNGLFKGEKGDKGDIGPQGEKGEKGDKGDEGTITVDQTYTSDSENLEDDLKGKWLIGWSSEDGGTFSNFDLYENYEQKTVENTLKFIKKKLL